MLKGVRPAVAPVPPSALAEIVGSVTVSALSSPPLSAQLAFESTAELVESVEIADELAVMP